MDSPEYTERTSRGLVYEVYRRFLRVSTDVGDILAEFGAAHIVREPDWRRWPWPIPEGGIPAGSIMLDRYGEMKASRHGVTPAGILNVPERRALLAAVLAMDAADVSHMQNDDSGCGAAVVATLRGISYAQAVVELYKGRAVRMMGTQRLAAATGTTCKRSGAKTLAEAIKAGAIAALIRRDGAKWGHYVAIAPGGVIVDPELVLHYPLADYPRRTWTPLMCFCRA